MLASALCNIVIVILMLSCFAAAILEFACMRDCKIPDNALSLMGRRILIVGLIINGLRLAYELSSSGIIVFSMIGVPAQLFIVFGQIIRCLNRLWVIGKIDQKTIVNFGDSGFAATEKWQREI